LNLVLLQHGQPVVARVRGQLGEIDRALNILGLDQLVCKCNLFPSQFGQGKHGLE
jgi:hypothetical protein